MVPFASKNFGFEPDAFVHELVDSIIGDNYPVPDRMLVHNERIVQEYLKWAMCGEPRPAGTFDLYAVEGGTAAMCYIFKSLKANRLLHPGDTIALGTPIFTPYLEMPHLEDYDLKIVQIQATQEDTVPVHRRRDQQARRSAGQGVLRRQSRQSDGNRDERRRRSARSEPGQDQAAGPDAADRRRLRHLRRRFPVAARRLPHNTIGVYSYSKYFGCHRLAARRDRRAPGQHLRQDDRRCIPSRRGETRSTSAMAR